MSRFHDDQLPFNRGDMTTSSQISFKIAIQLSNLKSTKEFSIARGLAFCTRSISNTVYISRILDRPSGLTAVRLDIQCLSENSQRILVKREYIWLLNIYNIDFIIHCRMLRVFVRPPEDGEERGRTKKNRARGIRSTANVIGPGLTAAGYRRSAPTAVPSG
jgi:hypothetical protein